MTPRDVTLSASSVMSMVGMTKLDGGCGDLSGGRRRRK